MSNPPVCPIKSCAAYSALLQDHLAVVRERDDYAQRLDRVITQLKELEDMFEEWRKRAR